MLTIEELKSAEFPFKLVTNNNSFIITEFARIEERNSTYNSESKSLFLIDCKYISRTDYYHDVTLSEYNDCEIGDLKDLSIIKHNDIEFQSFFNRMKFIQINDLQYLAGLSDIVKERLTPKVPYVIMSFDSNSIDFDFRKNIVNKEYVHSEDDSMFIADNIGFKGAANFKVENSNIFNKSFGKFANYDNFVINVHDNYFPFYIFNKLKSWKNYSGVNESLTFHFDKFKDCYNKIKNAGFPYIIEKLNDKEDLYVIARTGRDRIAYFKLFNLEENQTFSITEFNDVYNQLEENIITHLDPGFTKYIFRLAHEYTNLAIPNDKLYLIYERKEEFPENKLPFAYYSKDNGNYIVFDRTDSGDYKAFDYKSNSYIVIPLSIVEQMFEHNSSNENSVILNTSELSKHHHYKISNFIEIAEMKKDKQKTKDKNTWNSTGIDLDKVLSENKRDTFKPVTKPFSTDILKTVTLPIVLSFENSNHNIIILNNILYTDLYVLYFRYTNYFSKCNIDDIDNLIKDSAFLGYANELSTEDLINIANYNSEEFKKDTENHCDNARLLITGKSEFGKEFATGGIDLDEVLSENKETSNLKLEMENTTGTKQSEGKLNYELDFEFITQLAERMAQNKGKYEPYNWKKPIPVEGLKQALFRHVMDYMANDNTLDDGREYGHLESIALNVMMINYQLKNNKQ